MKIVLLLIAIGFIGCDLNQKVKDKVDNQVSEAVTDIENELEKSRIEIRNNYKNKLKQHLADSIKGNKLNNLFTRYELADNFIINLHSQLQSMDEYDVKNVQVVKELLDEGTKGDTLQLFVENALTSAADYSTSTTNRTAIDSLSKNIKDGFNQKSFALSNPMQASFILYGIQQELQKVELLALKEE